MKIYAGYLGVTFDTESKEMKALGTVEFEGQTLYLTQQAYIDNKGTDGDCVYRATAIDEKGNDYTVTWDAYETDEENECYIDSEGDSMGSYDDESNACDWEDYSVTKN